MDMFNKIRSRYFSLFFLEAYIIKLIFTIFNKLLNIQSTKTQSFKAYNIPHTHRKLIKAALRIGFEVFHTKIGCNRFLNPGRKFIKNEAC